MRRTSAVLATVAMVMAVAIGLAGCSSSDDSSTTTTAAAKGFEISTEDGQASISLSGDLPDGWPSSFPVPNRATNDTTSAGDASTATTTAG